MATLLNTRISDTYPGLIKTTDNAALTATLKQLTDGVGGASGLYANNAGDFKVTAILEWGSLKDTGTGVTITQWVTAANGVENFNNDTSVPTTAAVKTYVDAQFTIADLDFLGDANTGTPNVDLDSQNFSVLGTANEIETSGSAQTLTIGLPNDVIISNKLTVSGSGVVDATRFDGELNGSISSATTAVTQTAGNNSTKVATTEYVDSLDAGSDLDFGGDGGTAGAVVLNTQALAVTGTANQIETTALNQGLSLKFPSQLIIPSNTTATTQTAGDNSTKIATTAYVDVLDAASDLDITDGTTNGDVNLNTQVFSILGTANQVTSTVSNQSVTLSLPSSINVNSASATILQNARDISLTGEASATISSFNGSTNVSGAVTLDNNSVTGKVLTGLASPTATNILASDSILQAFGKTQSQLNTLAGGLRFMGTWNATTNQPTLPQGGNEAASGTTDGVSANKLVDSTATFTSTVTNGDQVVNQASGATALVTNVDSNSTLSIDADIMVSGQEYTIDNSPFLTQGHYYVVSFGGTHALNGISNWAVGDWVIAGATNVWEKLDHTQVDGTGTIGNITKWSSTNIISDSIMAESGTAITVTGSLSTTLGLNSGQNFAVNTDKFTVNSTNGNTAFTGDLAINTNKFTVNATSGNTLAAGTITSPTFLGNLTGNVTGNITGTVNATSILADGVTATTQSANDASTKVATTAYVDTSAGLYLPLVGGTLTGDLTADSKKFIATSSSSGHYVRMYGASGTGEWDIYGSGNDLRISENTVGGTGILTVDRGASFTGNIKVNLASAVAGAISVFDANGNTIWLTGRSSDGESSVSFRNNADSAYNGRISATDNLMAISTATGIEYQVRNGNGASGDHIFKSYNTAILTLNGATNAATFAGNVQAPSILANGFMEIRSDTASLYFENAANNDYYRLQRDANNFKIDYYNGSTTADRFTINSSGNIDLSPAALSASNGGLLRFKSQNSASGSYVGTVRFDGTHTPSGTIYTGASINGVKEDANYATALTFITTKNTGANAEIMRITSTGDTQLSGNNLDIKGTSAGNTSIRITDSTGTVGTDSLDFINDGTAAYIWNRANTKIRFGIGGNEKMQITTAGNVQILNPTATDSRSIGITNAAGTTGWTFGNGITAAAHQFLIYDNTAGLQRFKIDSDGDVGIGSGTTALGKLEVQQTATKAALWVQTGGTTSAYTIANFRTGTNAVGLSIKGDGQVGIGTDSPGAKLTIQGVGNELNQRSITNNNSQGYAQKNTIVSYYPSNGNATALLIPITSQGSLNSTTTIKIWGHSALFNDPNPKAFEATVQFGHLQTISNLNLMSSSGNIASVTSANTNPMIVYINFNTAYHNSNVNYSGCYVTIEYMTNNTSYSVIAGSIALN